MATLTVYTADRLGTSNITVNAVSASAGGDQFANTGYELLWIKNGGGGNITLTINVQETIDAELALTVTNATVTILAGDEYLIGPFPPSVYSDTNNNVQLRYSGVTSVTVTVMKPAVN